MSRKDMILHKSQYYAFIESRGVGSNDLVASSPDSYVSYLNTVSELIGNDISPAVLSSEADVEKLARSIAGQRAPKTINNYKSAICGNGASRTTPKIKYVMQRLDLDRLRNCEKEGTCWDVGNSILYDLCKKYPTHKKVDEILAKIWLIGRSYAAAIERRKKFLNYKGDSFHSLIVGPQMLAAKIDTWLDPLSTLRRPSVDSAAQVISAHKKLTDLFLKMTGLEKRSLASKYLHFHFPDLFYLYDSRASQELSKISDRPSHIAPLEEYDRAYAAYFLRCLDVVTRVKQEHGISLNPRQLDNYLLGFGK